MIQFLPAQMAPQDLGRERCGLQSENGERFRVDRRRVLAQDDQRGASVIEARAERSISAEQRKSEGTLVRAAIVFAQAGGRHQQLLA